MLLTKPEFKEIFEQCMKQTTCVNAYEGANGTIETDTFEVEPKCNIRDFEIATMDNPDEEFTDFEKAWEYFEQIHGKYRIIAANGVIVASNE